MNKINRPFCAKLDGVSVQINSFDFYEKIINNTLEENYNLKIKTGKEIESKIYSKAKNKNEMNFKCEFNGLKLDIMLELKHISTGEIKDGLLESTYEVISYKHI